MVSPAHRREPIERLEAEVHGVVLEHRAGKSPPAGSIANADEASADRRRTALNTIPERRNGHVSRTTAVHRPAVVGAIRPPDEEQPEAETREQPSARESKPVDCQKAGE